MTKLLVLDNNCLDQLRSAVKRDRLARTIHDEGWELWPTGSNVLEAVTAPSSDGLLSALHCLRLVRAVAPSVEASPSCSRS